MALYTREKSPYYWYKIVCDDGRIIQASTRIRHDATTPEQRKENKRLAEALYHEQHTAMIRRRDEPEKEAKATIPFAEFAEWYRTHVSARKGGHVREGDALKVLIAAFGPLPIVDVTKKAVTEWITVRLQTVQPVTVNREMDVLKHMLTEAVPTYLKASPIARMKRLKIANKEMATLSDKDEMKILAQLTPGDQTIIVTALDTLQRAGDILDLKWTNVKDTHIEILNPKSGGVHKVPVSKRLKMVLGAWKKQTSGTGYLFEHRRVAKTERDRTNSLKQMFERACRLAKVSYGRKKNAVTFHGLRHTGASRMIDNGVNPRVVQEIGGWANLRQLTRYTHPSEQSMRDAVDSIGANIRAFKIVKKRA